MDRATDYDLLIPVAPKDYNKAPHVVRSAIEHLVPKPKSVFIVSPTKLDIPGTMWVDEQEVMPLDPTAAKKVKRPRWIYQQFIKMFQQCTFRDNYLIVDSDLIFNKDVELFTPEGKIKFFLGVDQNHAPYFNFMHLILGFGREYDHSFISELMMFSKETSDELLSYMGYNNVQEFYRVCCEILDENNHLIADYEFYGQYAYKMHPEQYEITRIKTDLSGKFSRYSDEEIEEAIEAKKGTDYEVFTIHTWLNKEDR